jgi:rhodanese-related sulfurtransferase
LAQLPTEQPIVVYCYTGHTGQVAATALKLLGYDVQNLKYGMMGWTQNDEVLSTTRFGPDTDQRDYPVETEPNEATETYEYPTVATGEEDAFEIVRVAIDTALADWSPVTSADALFENLSDGDDSNNPVVLSVRSPEDYDNGHIAGAINIPWNQIATAENLAQLPADQPIVDYCYTGHTGQVAATVLKVLGYDVANLKYGMMGWTENDEVLATARYNPETSPDYPVEGAADAAEATMEETTTEEATAEETTSEEAAPVTMPETGGAAVPVQGALVALGTLTAVAGYYLSRRKAA